MTKKFDFEDQAKILTVQKHQLSKGQEQIGNIANSIGLVDENIDTNLNTLDSLLYQANLLCDNEIDIVIYDEDDNSYIEIDEEFIYHAPVTNKLTELHAIDLISNDSFNDWESLLDEADEYAKRNLIIFDDNIFDNLLTNTQRIEFERWYQEEFTFKKAKCDRYDYVIAGTCGLIGGLIDVFLVGSPKTGYLTEFTDDLTNNSVKKFANWCGWSPREGKEDSVASAIGFLERTFKVNYDHRYTQDVGELFKMNTKNHHMMSLGHSPDLLGLFFSILNQFTATASFIADGKIITIDSETQQLQGGNVIAKIFSGFCNWFGHLMSDVAGSSGASGRGSGIPIPFYSLLQFIKVGSFDIPKGGGSTKIARLDFAQVSMKVFEEGYDFRHGMAMAIPVLITELLTRISWSIKQHYYHKQEWVNCVPKASNPELHRMLTVAHGVLCVIDVADASIRSGGNVVTFMLHTNLIALVRFSFLAYKEIIVLVQSGKMDHQKVNDYLNAEYRELLNDLI